MPEISTFPLIWWACFMRIYRAALRLLKASCPATVIRPDGYIDEKIYAVMGDGGNAGRFARALVPPKRAGRNDASVAGLNATVCRLPIFCRCRMSEAVLGDVGGRFAVLLGVRRQNADAIASALKTVVDDKAPLIDRIEFVGALGDVKRAAKMR